MIEKLDYAMVPTGFVHCFNENCKNANRCLRHQIVRFIPDTLWAVSIVNPARTSPTGKCAAFMADTPVQYAVGMDHLLDQIPYLEAKRIKQRLLMTYGKNKFYQFKRKERIFRPKTSIISNKFFLITGWRKNQPLIPGRQATDGQRDREVQKVSSGGNNGFLLTKILFPAEETKVFTAIN